MIIKKGNTMRTHRGFTLIELMITIAIMAIIAVLAAPSFQNMILRQNLNKSARELVAVLTNARAKAALERREITVALAFAATTNTADTPTQLNWQPVGRSQLKTGAATSITFSPNGVVKGASNDTSFVICDQALGASSRTVSISMMGTIQAVAEGTCS